MSYHQCKSMSALAIWLRQMICFSNSTFSNIQCPGGPQPAIQGKQTLSGRERWWGYWWLHCGCVFLSGCGKGRTAEIGRRVGTSQRECYQWPSPCQRQVKKTPWHFPGLPCCTYCSGSFAIFAAEGSQKWFSLVQAGQTCWQELHCMTRSTSGRFLCFDHIQPSCREVLRRLERTRTSRTRGRSSGKETGNVWLCALVAQPQKGGRNMESAAKTWLEIQYISIRDWELYVATSRTESHVSTSFPRLLQVRVSRFYQRYFLPSSFILPPSSFELQIAVGTAGPQLRAPDLSGHCRTSTATSQWASPDLNYDSRSQWALPDLNHELQIAVGTSRPQPPDLNCERQISVGTAGPQSASRITVGIGGPQPTKIWRLWLRSSSAHARENVRICAR